MSKEAVLPDGTVLEFPDSTPDDVMDQTVRRHLGRGTAGDIRAAVGRARTRIQQEDAEGWRRLEANPLYRRAMNSPVMTHGIATQSPNLPNPNTDPETRARLVHDAVTRPTPLVPVRNEDLARAFDPANLAARDRREESVRQYGAAHAIGSVLGLDLPRDSDMEAGLNMLDDSRRPYDPTESWSTTFRRGLHVVGNQSLGETINMAPRAFVRGTGATARDLFGNDFGNSLERGLNSGLALIDLGAYGLESGARHTFGDDAVNNINAVSARSLGTDPEGSIGSLRATVGELQRIPQDPTVARAGERYAQSDNAFSGAANFLSEIIQHPQSIPNLLAEQAPALALGFGSGKIATGLAAPILDRIALGIGERAATTAGVSTFGAGMNAGSTVAHIGDNVAARLADPTLVVNPGETRMDAAIREGSIQTAGQLPGAVASGALLPVRTPLRGYAGVVPNTLVQAGIQGAGGLASAIGGNMALGRETSPAEQAAAFGGGALLAPVEVVQRGFAERAARVQAQAAEFEQFARAQAEARARDGRTADEFPAWSEAPARDQATGTWRQTADGIIAGEDGTPTVFRNHRQAAEFMVDNELGGDFEREFANGGIILRRRDRGAPAGSNPPEPPETAYRDMFRPGWEPPARPEAPEAPEPPAAGHPAPAPETPPEPAAAPPEAPAVAPVPPAPVVPPPPAPIPAPPTPVPPAPAQPEQSDLPDPGQLADGERYVATARGDKIRTRFEVVDASQLQQASGEFQNRDRTRASTDVQVQDIIGRFDPSRLGDSAEADRGAPIVGDDGMVESGNGRLMALNRIYDGYPDQAAAYRSFIEKQGYSTEGMDRPVLIRRRTSALDPTQRRRFIVDANRSAIMDLTPTERAKSDADLIDGDTLALYRGGDVSSADNRNFVRAFQGRLPAGEQGALIDSNGGLNQAGIGRIENALMARAYENPQVLEKLLESRDNNIRSIGGAMLDVSGVWGSLRADVAAGTIQPTFDVTPNLVEAARIVSDARSAGTKIEDLLNQGGMFGDLHPVTEQFIRAFYDPTLRRAAGRTPIGDILAGYVRRASEQTTAPRLVPVEAMTPEGILKGLLDERSGAGTGELFASPKEPPAKPDIYGQIWQAMEGGKNAHSLVETLGPEAVHTFNMHAMPAYVRGEIDSPEELRDLLEGGGELMAAEDRAPPTMRGRAPRLVAERGGKVGPVARTGERPTNSFKGVDAEVLGDEAETSDLDYTAGREITLKEAGAYDPEFLEQSFTNRESIYDSAVEAAGYTPAAFRLLKSPEQIRILAEMVRKTFGVEVTVKRGMQDRFAIDQLLDAFQNVRGMAFILGLPSRAISLGGGLKLELSKTARFLGAFAPGERKIMLPGRSNSFSHEWGHALDYYLLGLLVNESRGRGLSGAIRQAGARITDAPYIGPDFDDNDGSVRGAFVNLLNVIFFQEGELAARVLDLEARIAATGSESRKAQFQAQIDNILSGASQMRQGRTVFYRKARAMDGPGEEGAGTYWSSPTEMLARSFEAYVSYRAELQGFSTEFIGKGDAAYLSDADDRFAATFPKGEEREAIFNAYDTLFDRVGAAELLGKGPTERPGLITTTRPDLFRLPVTKKGNWFTNLMANEFNAIHDFMIRRAKEAEGRPNNPKGQLQRVQDVVSFYGYGMTARWQMLAKRYSSSTLLKLHDLLTHRTGRGDFTPRGLIHAVRLRENQLVNRLDRAMERNGFPRKGDVRKTLTAEESQILRDLLIGEKVPDAPANLVDMAAEMRRIEDEVFYDLQRAGIDVGYTRNGHLQRMIDIPKTLADEPKFVEKASEVYELVFDREQGTVEEILGDDKKLTAFIKMARSLVLLGHPLNVKGVARLIRQIRDLNEGGAEQSEIDSAMDDLSEALAELHGAARSAFAIQAANDWLLRIKTASPDEFDRTGPDAAFTKKRRLPPEADKILEDFYINDPVEVMATYLQKAARRVEYAERFGHDNSKLAAMFDRMAAEGVHPEDIEEVRDMFNLVTGRQASRISPSRANFTSAIHTIWGTVALLPRAVFSSLAESLTAGIVMESPVYGMKALADLITGSLGSAKGKERREIARFIGLIEAQGGADVLANRFGGTYGDATRWDRIAGKMFYKTGLVALTRAQHTHLIAPMHAYLDGLAGRIIDGAEAKEGSRAAKDRSDALARYRELGIRDPERFAREIRSTGRVPTLEELSKGMEGCNAYAYDWITAVDRLRDQIIQNPSTMDKPVAASNSSFGRLAYGIMAFNYAFWRNILKGSAQRAYERGKRDGFAYSAEKVAFGLLPAMASLLLAQTIISALREFLTNRARWDEQEKKGQLLGYLAWLGVTRTFGTPFDPAVQAVTGLKYQRDLTAVPLGPALGNILQNLQAMVMPFIRNSDKTNTAEYNGMRGMYRLAIGPLLGTALSAAPGGPLVSTLLGFGTGYVTSPNAGENFATATAGARQRRGRPANSPPAH